MESQYRAKNSVFQSEINLDSVECNGNHKILCLSPKIFYGSKNMVETKIFDIMNTIIESNMN